MPDIDEALHPDESPINYQYILDSALAVATVSPYVSGSIKDIENLLKTHPDLTAANPTIMTRLGWIRATLAAHLSKELDNRLELSSADYANIRETLSHLEGEIIKTDDGHIIKITYSPNLDNTVDSVSVEIKLDTK